jgi:hypothetical protein
MANSLITPNMVARQISRLLWRLKRSEGDFETVSIALQPSVSDRPCPLQFIEVTDGMGLRARGALPAHWMWMHLDHLSDIFLMPIALRMTMETPLGA